MLEAATELGDQQRLDDASRKLKILDWPCKMNSREKRGDS